MFIFLYFGSILVISCLYRLCEVLQSAVSHMPSVHCWCRTSHAVVMGGGRGLYHCYGIQSHVWLDLGLAQSSPGVCGLIMQSPSNPPASCQKWNFCKQNLNLWLTSFLPPGKMFVWLTFPLCMGTMVSWGFFSVLVDGVKNTPCYVFCVYLWMPECSELCSLELKCGGCMLSAFLSLFSPQSCVLMCQQKMGVCPYESTLLIIES